MKKRKLEADAVDSLATRLADHHELKQKDFIRRLVEAGWDRTEAVKEWLKIQNGEYDE